MVGLDRADLKKQMNARPRSRYLVLKKKFRRNRQILLQRVTSKAFMPRKHINVIILNRSQMLRLLV